MLSDPGRRDSLWQMSPNPGVAAAVDSTGSTAPVESAGGGVCGPSPRIQHPAGVAGCQAIMVGDIQIRATSDDAEVRPDAFLSSGTRRWDLSDSGGRRRIRLC